MIRTELEAKIKAIVESCGCLLYEISYPRENEQQILRISITKEKAKVGFTECEEVSKIVSPLLDVENPFEDEYFLEVSSPGVERTLKQIEHYQGAVGEILKVKTRDVEVQGELVHVDMQSVHVKTRNDVVVIPFDSIRKARTIFSIQDYLK